MTRTTTVLMMIGALAAVPVSGARPQSAARTRTVELITMAGEPASAPIADDGAGTSPSLPSAPTALQINDLNRRLVEFKMMQQLASPAAHAPTDTFDDAPLPAMPRVAWTSSIAVPAWLQRPSAQPAMMAFTPGCEPAAYRPTGFLHLRAEVRRATYYGMISSVACEHGIPVGLFDAMILRESGYNPAAVSAKQAFGLAQLMPGTAYALGVNRYDPLENLRGGARYLRQQLDRFGRVELALAAYNAGPGRVHNGSVPAISETQSYISNIIGNWQRIAAEPRAKQAEVIETQ